MEHWALQNQYDVDKIQPYQYCLSTHEQTVYENQVITIQTCLT